MASALGRKHRPPSSGTGIAIATMQRTTRAHMDALDRTTRPLDVTGPGRSNREPSHIHACFGGGRRYHGAHHVPSAEAPTTLVAFGALSGKPASFIRHIWRLCRPIAVI